MINQGLSALGSKDPNRFEIFIALTAAFLAVLLAHVMSMYTYLSTISELELHNVIKYVCFCFTVVLATGLAMAIIRLTLRIDNNQPGIQYHKFGKGLYALAAAYILFMVVLPFILEPIFPGIVPSKPNTKDETLLYTFLMTIVLAPIFEEYLFRHVCYKYFELFRLKLVIHAILVSVLFSLFHIIVIYGLDSYSAGYWLVYFFVCGMIFHLIRYYTNKLWPAIIAHQLHNSIILIIF